MRKREKDSIYLTLVNQKHPMDFGLLEKTVLKEYSDTPGCTFMLEEKTLENYKKLKEYVSQYGVSIRIRFGYRSFDDQVREYERSLKDYDNDREKVSRYVALPGESEHHTGLALDIIIDLDEGKNDIVYMHRAYTIIHTACPHFGFIVRYPNNKQYVTGYAYEPWHLRYVGKKAAMYISKHNLALEEYFLKTDVKTDTKNTDLKKYENILIMGCDVRADISEVENPTEKEKCMRSDAMSVVSVNRETGKIKLVSLNRDVLVGVHGYGYIKLNSPVVYGGPRLAVKVINDNFRLNIKKYIMISISNMIEFVDSIGGIDMELTDEEALYIDGRIPDVIIISKRNDNVPPLISGGIRHLNGMQTVAHARNRSTGTIYNREERINNVIKAISQKLKTEYTYKQLIGLGIRSLKYVRTNIGPVKALKLLRIGMRANINDIPAYHAPEEGTFEAKDYGLIRLEVDFSKASEKLWGFLCKEQS